MGWGANTGKLDLDTHIIDMPRRRRRRDDKSPTESGEKLKDLHAMLDESFKSF